MAAAQRQGGRGRGNLRPVDGERRDVPASVEGLVVPYDLGAQAIVICAVLNAHDDPTHIEHDAAQTALDTLKPEHFYGDPHTRIFEGMLALRAEGRPVEIGTVATWLRDQGRLEQIGGMEFLTTLAAETPTTGRVAAHVDTVLRKWEARCTIASAQRIAAEGYVSAGREREYVAEAARTLQELAEGAGGQNEGTSIADAVDEAHAQVQAIARGVSFGLLTGYTELDRLTGGFKAPEVTLLGAPPKTGKTSLAREITTNIARGVDTLPDGRTERRGVIWISLEMKPAEQALAWACTIARVDSRRLANGECSSRELEALAKAMVELRGLPIEIFGRRSIRYGEIKRLMREAKPKLAKKGARPRLLVIDHLQLLFKNEPRDDRRNDAAIYGDITRAIGDIAEWANLPILLITQLTEDEKGGFKARGSRDIEADANHMWILEVDDNKPAPTFAKGPSTSPVEATVRVKFSRGGPKGATSMWFRPAFAEFTETVWDGQGRGGYE